MLLLLSTVNDERAKWGLVLMSELMHDSPLPVIVFDWAAHQARDMLKQPGLSRARFDYFRDLKTFQNVVSIFKSSVVRV